MRLGEGVVVGCGCFGARADEPATWVDVGRNALLGGLAVIASGASGPPSPSVPALAIGAGLSWLTVAALRWASRRVGPPGPREGADPGPR
jgi:hypothetical protein